MNNSEKNEGILVKIYLILVSILVLFLVLTSLTVAHGQSAEQYLGSEVTWVTADSLVDATRGKVHGVQPGAEAIVYVPVQYRGQTFSNRVALGTVIAAADSVCTIRLSSIAAPVNPGYKIMIELFEKPDAGKHVATAEGEPFYRKKWFWPVVGGVAGAAILGAVLGGGGGDSGPGTGTVDVGGSLPSGSGN